MKAYIITDEDIEKLKTELARDPKYGYGGGTQTILTEQEKKAHEDAHRFYWYIVSSWVDKVTK